MNEENFTPNEQPILEPKKNNIVLIVIIVAIVAITAGVIGFLLAKKTQAPATAPAVTQPVTQTPLAQPADENADWKTYTNTKYGFEFKYPADLITKEDLSGTVFGVSFSDKNGMKNDQIALNQYKASELPSINSLIQQIKKDGLALSEPSEYLVSGIKGLQIIENAPVPQYKVFIEKDSFTYIFSIANESPRLSEFNKILSTFKFTNTVTDETADWKTYVNDSYGLSFKYPKTYTMDPVSNLKAGTIRTLKLFDTARPGNPTIEFVVPDGRGPFGPADILYDTEIEKGKIVIKNRKVIPYLGEGDTHTKDDKTYIEFEIGHLYGPSGNMYDSKYSATSGNGILVWFSYVKSEDYEQELKDIISSITITKPEIYGKK
ncbi:MAG TPA: hypothetical protein P5323_02225 [Candidatus Moranbacteria bacterium]|nr:hypothetical protein [Candidatus Moranbacteria bacterium]HRY27929.1 hypothetical protein [Candidatus Moranbacteria bacterium]HSA08618.1 hypothetical protein [Candidatus Moranbacteria bacterium]